MARIDRTTRKKDTLEVTYRVSRDVDPAFLPHLVPNGKVNALKIADMTTTQREFAALSSLEYYDLCNEVLEAKPSPIQKYGEEKVSSISGKYNLNRGQVCLTFSKIPYLIQIISSVFCSGDIVSRCVRQGNLGPSPIMLTDKSQKIGASYPFSQ